jgi:hypothetical protein
MRGCVRVRRTDDRDASGDASAEVRRGLRTLNREQHIKVACRLLPKRNEWFVLRRVVPSVEGVHVGELYDCDPLRFPVASLGHFVASTLRQVTPAVLGHHRPNLRPVFLELSRIRDDVFSDQVGGH